MGTTGLRLGVVATLGALAACNGRYEVGDGEGGEGGISSGTGGSSAGTNPGSGGSKASGGAAGAVGGSSGAGGSSVGGSSTGAVGGSGAGGNGTGGSGAGGSGAGGSGAACHFVPPPELLSYDAASPEIVWERISRFVYDEVREPEAPLPEETTPEWAESVLVAILDRYYEANEDAPAGLANFIREWAFAGSETSTAAQWAAPLISPHSIFTADLFAPLASDPSRKSMLEDEAFLTAYPRASARGAWIGTNLLCAPVGSPPQEHYDGVVVEPEPTQTSREALEAATAQPVCLGCHVQLDPPGFSLENYDATGAHRTTENGLPIDTSGSAYFDPHGQISFVNNADLLAQIVGTCEVSACFSSAFLDYALETAYGAEPPPVSPVERQYVLAALGSEYHRIRPLLTAVVTTPAFLRE
jgi:hypothetical protein